MYRLALCFLILLLNLSSKAQEAYQQYLDLSYAEIDSLVMIPYQKGDFNQCLLLMKAAQQKAKNQFGQQDSVFALYTGNLGFFYNQTGQYDKALPLYTQATDISQKVLGNEHPRFALSLNNLAYLHSRMGNYDKALPLFTQAKDIREKVLGNEHPEFAESLNNLAVLHQSMGNYDKALPLYTQAKDIQEKVLGKEHPRFALSLNNLATLHRSMSNYDKALPLYTQAKDIQEKVLGKGHPDFASSLNNLADLHRSMGNYDKALPLFTQAKDIYQKVLGNEHPRFGISLNNLADLHSDMSNYDKAWNILYMAINSQSRLQLSHSFDEKWLDSLKNAPYSSNEHIENMLKSLEMAYGILEKDSSIADAITKQAIVADLATALLVKARNQVSNEKDKLRMLAQSNDWLLKSLEVLKTETNNHKAFNRADENKSVLLLQATKSEAAYRLGELPDSLVWQKRKMLKKQSQLQAKLIEKRPKAEKDSLRGELIDVNQKLDDFVALVKKGYPKYHKLKYRQVETKAEDIQDLLDEQTALIEYIIGDSVVHIFCVTKSNVAWEKTFVSNKELSENIKKLHRGLSNYSLIAEDGGKAYNRYCEPAYWFYETLLAPVLKDKEQLSKLIIVTDGELGHLPFETFLVEQAPQQVSPYEDLHYLLNDYSISYNYSASLWKENKEAPTPENNGQILALAANYIAPIDSSVQDRRSYRAQSTRQRLSPLPAARKEVEALAAMYSGFFAFDSLASERVVKEKAGDFAILHFATHGLLDEKRPILSSLALTEDNDSTEDNFWQAYEISKMELNAELVVLSACETGFGKFETGNGIASLARSFMYAGAPSLIVSLWQVSDQATSKIMQQLYQNLAEGQAIDEALRQAKLDYIQSAKGVMAHPAFWSPFIQMGKTEPVDIQTKGGVSSWLFVGLGAVVLLVVGLVWRRPKRAE